MLHIIDINIQNNLEFTCTWCSYNNSISDGSSSLELPTREAAIQNGLTRPGYFLVSKSRKKIREHERISQYCTRVGEEWCYHTRNFFFSKISSSFKSEFNICFKTAYFITFNFHNCLFLGNLNEKIRCYWQIWPTQNSEWCNYINWGRKEGWRRKVGE